MPSYQLHLIIAEFKIVEEKWYLKLVVAKIVFS